MMIDDRTSSFVVQDKLTIFDMQKISKKLELLEKCPSKILCDANHTIKMLLRSLFVSLLLFV